MNHPTQPLNLPPDPPTDPLSTGERSFNSFGSHGASDHVTFKHFPSLADARRPAAPAFSPPLSAPPPPPTRLLSPLSSKHACFPPTARREPLICFTHCPLPRTLPPDILQVRAYVLSKNARLLGVEIDDRALPIDHPSVFCGPTAFILGNEGSGLSRAQAAVCDGFVYIPQHGPGTASLNVATAAGIVLHRFTSWARYPERRRVGNKCARPPAWSRPRGAFVLLSVCVAGRAARVRCASAIATVRPVSEGWCRFEVAEKPPRTGPRGVVGSGEDPEEIRARRAGARPAPARRRARARARCCMRGAPRCCAVCFFSSH